MQRINATLAPENQRALAALLDNLNRLAYNTDRSLAGLERTLASVGAAAEDVRALSRGLGEDASRLAARYDKLGEEATVAARDAASAMRQVSADVARISQRLDALLASGDVELRVTAQELRATADSLGAVARRLNDPRSILYGPPEGGLGPGEAR
jgi:methyl-accepting chemotaxis protein